MLVDGLRRPRRRRLTDLRLVIAGQAGWGTRRSTRTRTSAPPRPRLYARVHRRRARCDSSRARRCFAYPSVRGLRSANPSKRCSQARPVATAWASLPEVRGRLLCSSTRRRGRRSPPSTLRSQTRDLRTRLISEGHRQASTYSWDACADGPDSLYHELLLETRRARTRDRRQRLRGRHLVAHLKSMGTTSMVRSQDGSVDIGDLDSVRRHRAREARCRVPPRGVERASVAVGGARRSVPRERGRHVEVVARVRDSQVARVLSVSSADVTAS